MIWKAATIRVTRILAAAMILGSPAVAPAQRFVISTYAGGGPTPTPIAALQMAIDPQGMAGDSSGNLYFVSSNCIFKLGQNGIVTRVAGNSRTGYSGDGGPALTAQFRFASGVAVDVAGNLYIADAGNYRIRRVSPAGIISTVAGNGSQGYSGDGGPAINAQLSYPSNITMDSQGNLFLVDTWRVRKVTVNGIISTVAGTGLFGYSGDGGPAINAQLNNPYGVAADNAGNLYISDDGNQRIRMVSRAGIITTIAGTGVWGMSGDGGPAANAQLTGASGIVIDSAGNLYFSDSSPFSDDVDCDCIRKVSPSGIITTVQAGAGLFRPRALALDTGGDIYIADTGNRVIRRVSSDGGIAIAAGNGGTADSADGVPATSSQFYWPIGVAADAGGNVYIADTFNNRVRVVSPAGAITTIAGNGTPGYSGDGGPATKAQVYYPVGVAVDSHGDLYIADHGNSSVREVSKAGAITTVFGNGINAYAGRQVWGLTVDQDDNLYVPDPSNNRINKISPAGVITTVAGNGVHGYSGDGGPAISAQIDLTEKAALAIDREGSLYFSDDAFHVRKVSRDGTITTIAGDGTPGYSGDGGPGTKAQLGTPFSPNYGFALAADDAGNLYIADGDNHRIRMVSKAGIITTVAGTGTPGYTGDGGPATGAQLNGPAALAVDTSGNLYVGEEGNNVVRLLQPVSSNISIAGITNAASSLTGPIAPGEIVVVSGSGLGPAQLVTGIPGDDGAYPDQLAGTTVQFNGTPAPLIYTWATQVAVAVPYSVMGDTAQITVANEGQISATFSIAVSGSAPGLFTLDSTGKGQAIAVNSDGSINSPAKPAKVGDVISLFATGEGETTPAGVDGRLGSLPAAQPVLPVSVTIDGKAVTLIFAGSAPGEIAGVMRIDVRIPSGIQSGPAMPVIVRVGNNYSQQSVGIAVQ